MKSADCYLGVDGGGTKTRFVLIDGERRVLATAQLGSGYHPQVGLDGVRETLSQGIDAVLGQAGLQSASIRHAFFGIPAYGEDSRITATLDAMPRAILGHDRYACDNDMVCGWAGSLDCADGINIIAGTGSMSYGRRQGLAARAGGWGEIFSDEGSAYWIAVQGLNAYSRMSDGRLPKGPLYAHINQTLNLEHDLDLCARVYGEAACNRGEIARLSLLVAEAARLGDAAAVGIFQLAAQELAQIVYTLRRRLHFPPKEVIPVSYSGGAFSAGEVLLTPFADALRVLSPVFELREPLHEPDFGAALYALRLSGSAR